MGNIGIASLSEFYQVNTVIKLDGNNGNEITVPAPHALFNRSIYLRYQNGQHYDLYNKSYNIHGIGRIINLISPNIESIKYNNNDIEKMKEYGECGTVKKLAAPALEPDSLPLSPKKPPATPVNALRILNEIKINDKDNDEDYDLNCKYHGHLHENLKENEFDSVK